MPELLIEHRPADDENQCVTGYDEEHHEELDAWYTFELQLLVRWSAQFLQIRRHGESDENLGQNVTGHFFPILHDEDVVDRPDDDGRNHQRYHDSENGTIRKLLNVLCEKIALVKAFYDVLIFSYVKGCFNYCIAFENEEVSNEIQECYWIQCKFPYVYEIFS